MGRIRLKQVEGLGVVSIGAAIEEFIRSCRLRNLSPRTIEYYEEDLWYFAKKTPVKNVHQIDRKALDDFVIHEMNKGNRITAINTRLRGIRVFINFCAEREYTEKFRYPLLKEDEVVKEPYTDAELRKLLKRPLTNSWTEWRVWTAINTFLATGIRASTLLAIRISDIDFEQKTILLSKLKNRKQQMIPLSESLKNVLTDYLKLWDWDSNDYLFPTVANTQMNVHSLESAVRKYNISRGVSKTSLHLFRHTFAKNYVMAGGGMVQLQSILGHSTLDMTRKYITLYGQDIHRDFDRLNPLNNVLNRTRHSRR